MTLRSLTLGLLLAILVASLTYFNDFVIHQTMLIGTHVPVAVFGVLLIGVLGVGPAWGRLTGGRGRLRPGEVAVVVALGLAACAWPGSGFWRYTAGIAAMPSHLQQTELTWQSRDVLSYVPPDGALLEGGERTPITESLVLGDPAEGVWDAVASVPWRAWAPTLVLWVGSAGLLGLAGLCLSLVVHPQWANRELLAYPIARLVSEVTAREPGRRLPEVARMRLFWLGLGGVFVIHLANGLDVWFQTGVRMDLTLPFGPLRQVYRDLAQVGLSYTIFSPRVYFTVLAFAFFLPRSVSFSIGIAHIAFVAVGSVMISNGFTWGYERSTPANTSFLRLGAFVGMGLMIAYAGRRYYADVLGSAVGRAHRPDTPGYAVWALRLGFLCTVGATALLVRGGLAWDLALVLVGLILLSWLVLSRVICETGLFFVTNAFIPSTMIGGLFGFEAIGPTGMVMLTMASWVLIADPREALMPFVATGLRVVDRGGVAPGRVGGWLAVATVLSLVVAGVVTLSQQQHHGLLSMQNSYATRFVPSEPFNVLSRELAEAEASGTLAEAEAAAPLTRFASLRVWPGGITWGGLGLALVVGCAVLRLRVPWWPIHPILFVMWGTYAVACFYFSFLLGWAVKSAVVGVGGAKAYGSVKPLMIGLISGELLAILFWTVVGAIYYFNTGLAPLTYQIFPG